jgi:hypothetical protein
MDIACIYIIPDVLILQLMKTYGTQIIIPYKQYTFIFMNVWELREYILKYLIL